MQATAAALNYPAKKSLYTKKALKTPLYWNKEPFYGFGRGYRTPIIRQFSTSTQKVVRLRRL